MTSTLATEFRQARADPGLAVLEAFHTIKHAIRFGARVLRIVTPDVEELERLAGDLAPDIAGIFMERAAVVPIEKMPQLVNKPRPVEVIAIATRPQVDVDAMLADPSPEPVVYLEGPRNPGNIGAAIRVAAAAGAAGVLTSGRNDPWDPMVLRGSAGLHYALPVARVNDLRAGGRPIVALDPDGSDLRPGTLPARALLAFGAERHGLSQRLLRSADLRVRIPMREGVSSLNLATSVAAVLYGRR